MNLFWHLEQIDLWHKTSAEEISADCWLLAVWKLTLFTYFLCMVDWLIDWLRYRSYWGQVFTGQMTQPTVSKHWRKMFKPLQGLCFNPARSIPPCYNNTCATRAVWQGNTQKNTNTIVLYMIPYMIRLLCTGWLTVPPIELRMQQFTNIWIITIAVAIITVNSRQKVQSAIYC